MKTVLKNYSFNHTTRVITLTDVATVRLDRLALITDTTTNKILYNFADSTVSTATVSTNTITLSALQGGEADADKLRIDYDTDTADTAFGDSTNATKVVTSALPTGAATSAKQDTGNTSVASIDTKTPALGQALAAASVPVILPSATITTLTPPANPNPSTSTKQSDGTQKTQVVDGSGNVIASSGNALSVAPGQYQASPPGTYSDLQRVPLLVDNYGQAKVVVVGAPSTPAGTALIGKVGIDQTTPGTTNNVELTGHGGVAIKDDTAVGDGLTTGILSTANRLWNGTNYDRMKAGLTTGSILAQAVQQDVFASATAFTITLASLASSVVGVGRQSTLVTGNTARSALIAVKFTVGTTPTANTLIYVYLIRGDGTLNDDGAGASDAALTVINAPLLGTILVPAATSNTAYTALFDTKFLGSLGPSFGIAVVNSTAVTANATGGNFTAEYRAIT